MTSQYQRPKLEDQHSTNDITHGNFGTATYREDSQKWNFLQGGEHVSQPGTLPLSSALTSILPSRLFENGPRLVVNKQFKLLVVPQQGQYHQTGITEAGRRFAEIGYVSQRAKEEAFNLPENQSRLDTDTNLSPCLDFGAPMILRPKGTIDTTHGTVCIAAFAAGPNGERVKLVRLAREPTILRSFGRLIVPTLSNVQESYWDGGNEPVLQICFSSAVGSGKKRHSTRLAIRAASGTVICLPLHHQVPKIETQGDPSAERGYTPLEVNPFARIPISHTGGSPQVDFSFHPLDVRTFAIVDANGTYSIWQMRANIPRGRVSRVLDQPLKLQGSGSYQLVNRQISTKEETRFEDGWYRLCWIQSSDKAGHKLLVFGRRNCLVISDSAQFIDHVALRIGLTREGQRILEVKSGQPHSDLVYVLTSSRIVVLVSSQVNPQQEDGDERVSILLSCVHDRSKLDPTLTFTIIDSAEHVIILIYSRRFDLATAITMTKSTRTDCLLACIGSPLHFSLAERNRFSKEKGIHNIIARPVGYVRQTYKKKDRKLFLYKLFVQRLDLAIQEYLYESLIGQYTDSDEVVQSQILILPQALFSDRQPYVDWFSEHGPTNGTATQHGADSLDNTATGESPFDEDSDDEIRIPPVPSDNLTDQSTLWTAINASEDVVDRPDFEVVLQDTWRDLSMKSQSPSITLVSDSIEPRSTMLDLEEASTALQKLLTRHSHESGSGLYLLPLQPLASYDGVDLLDKYSAMLSSWLTPSGPSIPDRNRVNKERLIRSIATEQVLASVAVRKVATDDQGQPSSPTTLPPWYSSQLSSQTSNDDPPPTTEEPALSRLRAYTTFTPPQPQPPLSTVHHHLISILAHLPTSLRDPTLSNPATYSLRAIDELLAEDAREANFAALTAAEQRRTARERERQERGAEAMRVLSQRVEEESQVPGIMTGGSSSQPVGRMAMRGARKKAGGGFGNGDVGSSQLGGGGASQDISMTQPVAGAFGNRPENGRERDRKRKRSGP